MSRDDPVVAAAKTGDPDAWRELYRAHAGRLVVWLEHRSPADGSQAAEDLAADTWLTAASKLRDFHGSGDDFGGWLFGIARRLSANARRTSARRQTYAAESTVLAEHAGTTPGPEVDVSGRAWVYDALARLSPKERDVVACTEVVGLDVADTARALGMTAVAVRVARHRALKRLRQILDVPAPAGERA